MAKSNIEKPPQPHPDCVWHEKAKIWIWPDNRDAAQKASDELAADLAESGEWEKHGFRRKHSARVDSP